MQSSRYTQQTIDSKNIIQCLHLVQTKQLMKEFEEEQLIMSDI